MIQGKPAVPPRLLAPPAARRAFGWPPAIASLAALAILAPWGHARAAGSAPVTVVNTAANPVPVTPLGTTAVTGEVKVTNTSANPVPITGSVSITGMPRATSTSVLYDQRFTSVAGGSSVSTPVIDVSTFRQIRVVVGSRTVNFCYVFVDSDDDAGNELGILDAVPESGNAGDSCQLNKVYDTPGVAIEVQMTNALQTTNDFRVTVFGQPY